MSNRAVSATYRTIIDDVILNVRQDFEDMGIEKEVLDELQRSWEAKIIATGVADFEGAAPVPPRRRQQQSASQSSLNAAGGADKAQNDEGDVTKIKDEQASESDLQTNGNKRARINGASDVGKGDTSNAGNGNHGTEVSSAQQQQTSHASANGNGAASSSANGVIGQDITAAEGSNALQDGSHANKRKRPISDDDAIGSDLDDSDEDEMEGNVDADGNEDMILCLYDKVQRVRNKWKCILKDGIASIDGRDYVFSKLSSELEW